MRVRSAAVGCLVVASLFVGASSGVMAQPATWKEPAIGVQAKNLSVKLVLNGMPLQELPFRAEHNVSAHSPECYLQGENILVVTWDSPKGTPSTRCSGISHGSTNTR